MSLVTKYIKTSLGGKMKKKMYKSFHLMFVPYDKKSSKSIFLTARVQKVLTLASIVIVVVVTSLITRHTKNYYKLRTSHFPTLKENTLLAKENKKMKVKEEGSQFVIDSLTAQLFSERAVHRERLKSLNMQVERVKKFAEELRVMVGFKLEPKEAQPPGLGGPVSEDEEVKFLLTEDVENDDVLLAFDKGEKQVLKKLSSAKDNLKLLWSYFENKNFIIEGTPEIQPVPGSILSGFGYRINPFTGREEMHRGVDIPAPIGTKIRAPSDGVVVFVGRRGGYGKILEIDHGNSYKTVYGHLHAFDVEVGDRVKKGDFIGEVGNTGRSTGPHLHYEVRLNNVAVNPITYFRSVEERKREFEEEQKVPEKPL